LNELDEFIEHLEFKNITYLKDEEYDHLHTLVPFETNSILYALRGTEKKR